MTRLSLGLAFVLITTSVSHAEPVVCRGEVTSGTLDSGVGDCSFLSNSKEAATIFNVCKIEDQCQVEGQGRKTNFGQILTSVSSIKLLNGPALTGSSAPASNSGQTQIITSLSGWNNFKFGMSVRDLKAMSDFNLTGMSDGTFSVRDQSERLVRVMGLPMEVSVIMSREAGSPTVEVIRMAGDATQSCPQMAENISNDIKAAYGGETKMVTGKISYSDAIRVTRDFENGKRIRFDLYIQKGPTGGIAPECRLHGFYEPIPILCRLLAQFRTTAYDPRANKGRGIR